MLRGFITHWTHIKHIFSFIISDLFLTYLLITHIYNNGGAMHDTVIVSSATIAKGRTLLFIISLKKLVALIIISFSISVDKMLLLLVNSLSSQHTPFHKLFWLLLLIIISYSKILFYLNLVTRIKT